MKQKFQAKQCSEEKNLGKKTLCKQVRIWEKRGSRTGKKRLKKAKVASVQEHT